MLQRLPYSWQQWRRAPVQCGFCTTQYPLNPLTSKRLQQVIESAKFKCSDGVLIVGRGEYHLRFIVKLLKNFQPSCPGHHDIQKHQVWTLVICQRNRRLAVLCLLNWAAPAEAAKVFAQRTSCQRLIVGNKDGSYHRRAPISFCSAKANFGEA